MVNPMNIATNAAALVGLLFLTAVNADTLTLKDGQVLKGTLVKRTAGEITFEVAGQPLIFEAARVHSVAIEMAPATTPALPATQQAPGAKPTLVPAGTRLLLRTNSPINSRKHKAGHRFKTTLEADIVVGNISVIPRGATVYGLLKEARESSRVLGKSKLVAVFTDILINNRLTPIVTANITSTSESTGATTLGRTARTAAVGGLIDGSDGAKTGARVGLGLSILSPGNKVEVPAGTLVEVRLAAPLQL